MTVYVDTMAAQFGRMKMCHLWADNLDELLAMADKIGVRRKWLQRPRDAWNGGDRRYAADERLKIGMDASWVHFDIALSKKEMAIANGAVLTDRFGPNEHTARLMIATGIPQLVESGERQLQRYAAARARANG